MPRAPVIFRIVKGLHRHQPPRLTDDWFLPLKDELNALCKWALNDTVNAVCNNNGSGLLSLTFGDFSPANYWSSSEYDDNNSRNQYFGGGNQYAAAFKYGSFSVRPVRTF